MSDVLLSDNLFSEVLLNPAKDGASDLYIISGYASSAMVFHHAEKLKEQNSDININLIIGMTCRDGLSKTNHRGFQSLVENDLSGNFNCSYLINRPPVHSKVYTWVKDDIPVMAFAGSANYSQQAFIGNSQREVATKCDPATAYAYYNSLIDESIYCDHQDAEEVITLYNDNRAVNSTKDSVEEETAEYDATAGLEHELISLINRSGEISQRSGLNWGQRGNREPNQAYIPLKVNVYSTDFFPPVAQHFTIHTDDGKILICTRAQENGKAIHTPQNNSLIGEYFRFRLGVANGNLVTMDDLTSYGRTDIDFYKIDEENYYMDFSV